MDPFPTRPLLRTPEVVLRPLHASDLEAMRAAADDPRVVTWMRDRFPNPYTAEAAARWLRIARAEGIPDGDETENENAAVFAATADARPCSPACLHLAICTPADGRFAGAIGLETVSDDGTDRLRREIGYWVAPALWGRGLATAACTALARWALTAYRTPSSGERLERIEAHVYVDNAASARVLTRAGFVREGVQRRAVIKHGRVVDLQLFSLVQSDLETEIDGFKGGIQ